MLNNEEPINLMFRTSPQLLTKSSYDSIRRQNDGEVILLQSATHLAHLVLKTPTTKYDLFDHFKDPSACKGQREELLMKYKYCPVRMGQY